MFINLRPRVRATRLTGAALHDTAHCNSSFYREAAPRYAGRTLGVVQSGPIQLAYEMQVSTSCKLDGTMVACAFIIGKVAVANDDC